VADLELLAHYELRDSKSGDMRSGFAVILELTDRRLLLEGDVPFEAGDQLDVNFFLPDSGTDSGRTKVALCCVVAQCRDTEQLQYSMQISKISEASKSAIQNLHAENGSGSQP
jgi:hypothetical protein